jgi:plastocyanin
VAALAVVVAVAGPAPSGSIEGKTTYEGTPPTMKAIDMEKEPKCAKKHNPPMLGQTVVTGPANALQYVLVYISAGGPPSPIPSETVRFDEKDCAYLPHILPMQVGQLLRIYSDDPVSHNIHPRPVLNTEWNKAQPPGSLPINTTWEKPEIIEVKCDVHSWMHGYFAVLKTSHYMVSDSNGSYSLKGLTPGIYTITAWQEQYGAQSQQVKVVDAATTNINFVFKVSPSLNKWASASLQNPILPN